MHIILTCNFSPWSRYSGGGQQSTHRIAVQLAERGHQVEVVYTKPPWETVRLPAGLPYAVHWAALPAWRSRSGIWFRNFAALSVKKVVATLLRRHSLVHANGEESAALYQLRNRQPFAFVITPRYPRYPDRLAPWPADRPLRLTDLLFRNKYESLAWALHHADGVFPTSHYAAGQLADRFGFDPRELAVIPNGIAPVFFAASPGDQPASPSLLFFGRLEQTKGVHLLVEALRQLPDAVRCTFIGRGGYESTLRTQIRRCGLGPRVCLKPWMPQEELVAEIHRSSLVCLPSLEESFGNAIAEAMATGTPVVATRTGAIPELIRHDQTGFLVRPNSVGELVGEIRRLLDHPRLARQVGRNGRQSATSRFRWEAVAAQFEDHYERSFSRCRG